MADIKDAKVGGFFFVIPIKGEGPPIFLTPKNGSD